MSRTSKELAQYVWTCSQAHRQMRYHHCTRGGIRLRRGGTIHDETWPYPDRRSRPMAGSYFGRRRLPVLSRSLPAERGM